MTAPLAIAAVEPIPAPVSFWEALHFWLKLGFISFGGPAGQISIMHQELVENRRQRFSANYMRGSSATYIGW